MFAFFPHSNFWNLSSCTYTVYAGTGWPSWVEVASKPVVCLYMSNTREFLQTCKGKLEGTTTFDSHPLAYRNKDDAALERMCYRLGQLPNTFCLLQLLSPVIDSLRVHTMITPTPLPAVVTQISLQHASCRTR